MTPNQTQPAGASDAYARIPGLQSIGDAADYLARNPDDDYAKRRLQECLDKFASSRALTSKAEGGDSSGVLVCARHGIDYAKGCPDCDECRFPPDGATPPSQVAGSGMGELLACECGGKAEVVYGPDIRFPEARPAWRAQCKTCDGPTYTRRTREQAVEVWNEKHLTAQPAPVVGGDALALAVRFHETYERLAPSFGYETRTDTRTFDPESKNGKLMVAVCRELSARPAVEGGNGAMAVKCIEVGMRASDRKYRDALQFYARREHWMQVSENAEARTLLVAGGPTGTLDAWSVAQLALESLTAVEGAQGASGGDGMIVGEIADVFACRYSKVVLFMGDLPVGTKLYATPPPATGSGGEDTRLLDFVASEYLHLIPFSMPTPGGDDADVGWVVKQSTMRDGDVELARHYSDDPRAAIEAAIQAATPAPASGS
jgi:hypothetical protein